MAGTLPSRSAKSAQTTNFSRAIGETYYLSTMAALLSRVVRDQGRDDEALVVVEDRRGGHRGGRHRFAGAMAFDPGADRCARWKLRR